jgi:hypothetical protein
VNYRIERTPYGVLVVHVDQQITPSLVMLRVGTTKAELREELQEKRPSAKKLLPFLERLIRVGGLVDEVFVDRYSVQVAKAPLFSWDQIEPKILRLMKVHVAKGGKLEEIGTQELRQEVRRRAKVRKKPRGQRN